MEFRQNIKIAIVFAFIALNIGALWYIGLPKEMEVNTKKRTPIPSVEAKNIIYQYNPNHSYFYNQDFVIMKNKTAVPFMYENDTIYRTKVTAMHVEK